MSTPDLYLTTSFILDCDGRIVSTREPNASNGPLFTIAKSLNSCAWAVHADVPHDLARELDQIAQAEPPALELKDAPVNAARYIALLRKLMRPDQSSPVKTDQSDGPAFAFPASIAPISGVVAIEDERLLERNFRGWVPGEIASGCGPVLAVVEGGAPVSICFCARRSDLAAEAGVETAAAYRGRGFAPRVTAAWAAAVRASGRTPLYSTSWTNQASLRVAEKLKLVAYASSWSLP